MHRIVPSKEIGLSSMHNLILMQKICFDSNKEYKW